MRRRLKWLIRSGLTNRGRLATYLKESGSKRLHLGCGRNLLTGWLNTDYLPLISGVVHIDATARFPIPDQTFDYVYSEHMIEHIPYAGGQHTLSECFRVLKPGGTLRLSTPDLGFLLAMFGPNLTDVQRGYMDWAAKREGLAEAGPTFVLNNYVRAWGHLFIYDEATLRRSMERAGFAAIKRRPVSDSDDPSLRGLEHVGRMPSGFLDLESVVLEATR